MTLTTFFGLWPCPLVGHLCQVCHLPGAAASILLLVLSLHVVDLLAGLDLELGAVLEVVVEVATDLALLWEKVKV